MEVFKMRLKTKLLPELFESVYKLLAEHGYSQKTQTNYRCTYNQLMIHLERCGTDIFTEEAGMDFINQHYGEKTKYSRSDHHANLKRRIKCLVEVHEGKFLSVRRYTEPKKELKHLNHSLDIYKNILQQRNLVPATINAKCCSIERFFIYLEESSIQEISSVTVQHVYDYLNETKYFAVSTKEMLLYTLRDFFISLSGIGLCDKSLGALFPQISTHAESAIPSSFTPKEVRTILLSVDRSTAIGKRDYAVLLLASFLGIRASDIRDMKISYIKWAAGAIEFTQSKTGRHIELPMPHELRLALLDYLKNARPKVQSDNLFVRMNAPHSTFTSKNVFRYILKKYLVEIDLNGRKHGLHSLRFSAAGNMLSEGVNITTICNVLGHVYSDTTNHYLKIDVDQLRKAALEVVE